MIRALFVGGQESASPGGTEFPYKNFPTCEWVCETSSREHVLPWLHDSLQLWIAVKLKEPALCTLLSVRQWTLKELVLPYRSPSFLLHLWAVIQTIPSSDWRKILWPWTFMESVDWNEIGRLHPLKSGGGPLITKYHNLRQKMSSVAEYY